MSTLVKEDVTLKRAMGFWQAFGIGVGLVICGTTMVSMGFWFGMCGPAFVIPAAIAGLCCILMATSYAEMAAAIPGAGMISDYTLPAMGKSMSMFGVFAGYIVLVIFAGSVECFIAGMCVEQVWGLDYRILAMSLLVIFLIINCIGIEFLGKMQLILTIGKVSIMSLLGIGGILGFYTVSEASPLEFAPNGMGVVTTAFIGGFWLYVGIEYICPMAEEIIRPEKNIPKAMITGIIAIFSANMLFGFGILKYTPLDLLVKSDVPQLVGAEHMYGMAGTVLLTIGTLLASGSAADSHMAAIPRMFYGLARDGRLPKIFGYLNPRTRTPLFGIVITFLLMSFPLLIGLDINTIMSFINMACVSWLTSYIIVQSDVIILRKKYPNLHRPFKSPLFPIPQIIGIIACLYAIVTSGTAALIGGILYMIVCMAYSILWVKFKMKEKCFSPLPINELKGVEIKFDGEESTKAAN